MSTTSHYPSGHRLLCTRSVWTDTAYTLKKGTLEVPIGLGFDGPVVADLRQLKSILIAGSTGSGKSNFFHNTLLSLMRTHTPEQLRIICIDPKRVELTVYNVVPHALTNHTIVDAYEALQVMTWLEKEIDQRSKNRKLKEPNIVLAIDEVSDIMVSYPTETERLLVRIATDGADVGVFLIMATSRPSINIFTEAIRKTVCSRLTFKVASSDDSNVALGRNGAELLLGAGDGLLLPFGELDTIRLQVPYISFKEIQNEVEKIRTQYWPEGSINLETVDVPVEKPSTSEQDEQLYESALSLLRTEGQISMTMLQQSLKIGYGRAMCIMDRMEEEGALLPSDGTNAPRVSSNFSVNTKKNRHEVNQILINVLIKLLNHFKLNGEVIQVDHNFALVRYRLRVTPKEDAHKIKQIKNNIELALALCPITIESNTQNEENVDIIMPYV